MNTDDAIAHLKMEGIIPMAFVRAVHRLEVPNLHRWALEHDGPRCMACRVRPAHGPFPSAEDEPCPGAGAQLAADPPAP